MCWIWVNKRFISSCFLENYSGWSQTKQNAWWDLCVTVSVCVCVFIHLCLYLQTFCEEAVILWSCYWIPLLSSWKFPFFLSIFLLCVSRLRSRLEVATSAFTSCWSNNTDHLHSILYFLKRLQLLSNGRQLLWIFYQLAITSVLFYAAVCQRDSSRMDNCPTTVQLHTQWEGR